MAEWEPGDDICPPWPWHWHGPRPPWWVEEIIDEGQQVYIALSLISAAGKVANPEMGLQVAKVGGLLLTHSANALNKHIEAGEASGR